MPEIDIDALAQILRDAAIAEIMPRFGNLEPGSVKTKSEAIDLVTIADTEAEKAIKARVAALWPDALFVGEESVAADPALLDKLKGAELAITVDPVDGTANFAAGLPLFGVMAAVIYRGETVAGIIYDPMGDDWFMAEKGSGAFRRTATGINQRLHVADPVPLAAMVGSASTGFLPKDSKPRILANLAKVRIAACYRCAAHEYRPLVSGHSHFSMYYKLMPWDHLPGTLIAKEAGAHVAKLDGSDYLPGETTGGLLVATDKASWEQLRREVFNL